MVQLSPAGARPPTPEDPLPTAANITIPETLGLLDGPFLGLASGVADGGYAFWLGSGVSRDRVIGLDGVLAKLIEFLRAHATADPNCSYRAALDKIVALAGASADELATISYAAPAATWPCLEDLLKRLWNQYSAVLSVEVPPEALDYLLWVGLDFPVTFAAQDPDAEHLAVGMLALEGVVSEIATTNWDGLFEAAMADLGYADAIYRITVTGEDLRTPQGAHATLYKFHGCALRAIKDEAHYRQLLVARSAQIAGWMNNATFKIVRDQLEALIQRSRTLVIGLSAQDRNIQHLFGKVGAVQGWKWTDQPTPIVFSAQELGDDQKVLLEVAYGAAYEANRVPIWEAARLQAHGKPLLLALLLWVLCHKVKTLAEDAVAPGLDAPGRAAINDGISHLRDRIAEAGDPDRLSLAKSIAWTVARARHQLQDGSSPSGVLRYFPLDTQPSNMMRGKPAMAATGQREAAVAIGLIGLDVSEGAWTAGADDPTDARSGALRIASDNAEARVFFAANDDTVTTLLEQAAFDEDDRDVVLICSKRVSERQQRNPSRTYRTGKFGPRYLSFGPMLAGAPDLDALRDAFRKEVAV